MADTVWLGAQTEKLFLQSGEFSSTVKTSQSISVESNNTAGVSWDGTDTPWNGTGGGLHRALYLQSGQFSSTVKVSLNVGSIDTQPSGVSWDGTDTPWNGFGDDKLYLQSGQFTSTLKTSEAIGGIDGNPRDLSWDGTNTPWCSWSGTLYLQSGKFTSTLKTSEIVSGIDNTVQGISYNGTDTLWSGSAADKLYLQSGQFTSTLKTSESVGGIDINPHGVEAGDVNARLAAAPPNVADPAEVILSLALPVPTVVLLSNQVITPVTLTLSITLEATPHVDSNVASPGPITMGVNGADPVIDFGQEVPVSELSMSMNLFAPTINIITQTIVSPAALNITAVFVEGTATPDYSWLDSSLPLMTLNAEILNGFIAQPSLPILTLSANCVVGFLTYTTGALPMLTLGIRMGLTVGLGLPMFTLTASGTTSNGAKLTKPLPLFTLIASGKSTNNISLAQPLPMFTLDAVMVIGGVHSFASNLPMFTLDGRGINGGAAAVLSENLPLVTLSAAGYSDGNGTLAKSLPLFTLDAFGTAYTNRII